jgi:NAD(P)H dehydrogenase (quinone)
MRILLVLAHPLEDSLCCALANSTLASLQNKGHRVEVEDLYRDGFDPVLNPDERRSYYREAYADSGVRRNIQNLLAAQALILVFPTWWFGFPAILKGWFDRVWAPTFAYEHADDLGPIRPKLDRLKLAFVVTTLGAPWWVDHIVLRTPVKRTIKHALLGACARHCRLKYLSFYKCEKITPERMKQFNARIATVLDSWF